jgi:PAS domain S-box-containing protein
MLSFITPIQPPFYLSLPDDWMAWVGWLALLGLVTWAAYSVREPLRRWTNRDWTIFIGLAFATAVTTLFIGMRLPASGALPVPGRPEEPRGPVLMFLLAVPWMLAGGLLGPVPAGLLGLFSGLLLGFTDTNSLYTPLEMAGLALLFSAAVRQRYRTLLFKVLRHPLGIAAVLALFYIPAELVSLAMATSGVSLVARVDYALTRLSSNALAIDLELLLGGALVEIIALALPLDWGRNEPLKASPIESSLQSRFFYSIGPLVLILLGTLMVGDWVVAGDAARAMLRDQLSSTARVASETVPFFLDAGQNLILQFAQDTRLSSTPSSQIPELLHQNLTSVPYFRQLFLLDQDGHAVAGYPENDFLRLNPGPEELNGIQLALKGIAIQVYTVTPDKGETTAQVSFVAAVKDSSGKVTGVLVGRSDLASNPFTKPIIQTFDEMNQQGEQGIILDENGKILYHPIASRIMQAYGGRIPTGTDFYDETGSDGTRNLVYFQPTLGRSWAIVLTVPAQQAQQKALDLAIPLMVMILVVALLVFIILRLSLRVVTASLQNLAGEAGRIAHGELDHPLPVQGEDEVGQLRQAFEQMRLGLKDRLDELNRLLLVSQGVASSLEMESAVQPILEAALSGNASSARVALALPGVETESSEYPSGYGRGPSCDMYAYLDEQIIKLSQNHDRLVLANLTRGRGLTFTPGQARPGALLAFPLRRETQFFGTLWVAFDNPRQFGDEEVRFLATLAGEAALAAANARLYATAEIGRQRLEAILSATPDPVLVTDQHNRILLFNPAASELPGLDDATLEGKAIDSVLTHKELIDLVSAPVEESISREIYFPNGRVYYATVSQVVAGGQQVGKICLLRNITHFKEVDSLKSDFVTTVSHDLRSPLTLMRGYATMMQMVGDLNEQQKGYVRKIITGVESMSRLVNSLLDLGRIEAGVGLQLETIAAGEVVERVISSLQLQATQKNIKLNQIMPEVGGPIVQVDQALLQQALYNLVENGIKYTQVGGQVTIRTEENNGWVLFEVKDTGIGIAPIDQPRLFDRFYKAGQRDLNQPHGSGLGLTIVKSIAERHGGRVWLESHLGKGSTFSLEIPVRQEQREESTQAE